MTDTVAYAAVFLRICTLSYQLANLSISGELAPLVRPVTQRRVLKRHHALWHHSGQLTRVYTEVSVVNCPLPSNGTSILLTVEPDVIFTCVAIT